MSVTPPPPLDPSDPRAGDPTNPVNWVRIGGVIIVIIVIGTITRWNSGGGGGSPPPTPPGVTTSSTAAAPGGAPPTGTYKIIFEGEGSGDFSVPNNCQSFKSDTATATWRLEYTYGQGFGAAPDPATVQVSGSGDYKLWHEPCPGVPDVDPGADCQQSTVTYQPNVSVLRSTGSDVFSLTAPLAGDLLGTVECDPFFRAWNVVCEAPSTTGTTTAAQGASAAECATFGTFPTAEFTIREGQTGTVVTQVATRRFRHVNEAAAGTTYGSTSDHSWSGTITVIAQ